MSYRFVAAAISWHSFAGLGIFVKHHSVQSNKITIREISPNHAWLVCPDRELLLVKDQHHMTPRRPLDCNFDEFVSLDIFDPRVARAFNVEYFMTNSIDTEKTVCPNLRANGYPPDGFGKILTDSGGFQLIQQRVEHINPHKLVDHYNRNSDIGMVLDVPTLNVKEDKMTVRSAKVQAMNTDIMMREKRKDLELMNVFHGETPEAMTRFRKIVERDDIQRVAIGGTPDISITAGIDQMLEVIMNGMKYKHYHALGIYNIPMMLPFIRMANMKGFKGLLTSDASTALASANNKMYHKQSHQFSPPRRLRLGDIATRPTTFNTFPCPCPVCATIKYVDILSVLDGALYRHILHFHNVWEIMRYSRQMDEMAKLLSHKDYKEMARQQLANAQNRDMSLATIDFIHRVEQDGLKKARQKYKAHLLRSNMWDATKQPSIFKDSADEADVARFAEHYDFLSNVLARYERQDHSEEPKGKGKKKKKGRDRQKTASRFSKKSKVGKQKKKNKKVKKKSLKMMDAEARQALGAAA